MGTVSINFKKPYHVYFIGISGVSMNGLAEIPRKEGFSVNGSDAKESEFIEHLKTQGMRTYIGQRTKDLNDSVSYVIYTAVIHSDNPGLREAKWQSIPMLGRAELLGQLIRCHGESIVVSNTHGKTTTTSILSLILLTAKEDPTISLGEGLDVIDGSVQVGGSDTFPPEAREYTNSFLSFFPALEVILNIEADHPDFFKDTDDICHSFRCFVRRMPESGSLVIDSRTRDCREIVGDSKGKVVMAGTEAADYCPTDIRFGERGSATFTLTEHGRALPRVQLCVPGKHSVYNALAALTVCRLPDIPAEIVRERLEVYRGTERRLGKKGEYRDAVIADNYAHRPQEIAATLETAKNYPYKALWCVLQSHTHTRIKALLPDFGKVLEGADHVLLTDIYAAREIGTLSIILRDVAEAINADQPGKARYFSSFGGIEDYLDKVTEPGDLVSMMGAGDTFRVGGELLERTKAADVER